MTKQILVANAKGGCGKTTLLCQLAAWYALQGDSVAIVDHDVQSSALDWLNNRCPSVAEINGYKRKQWNGGLSSFDVVLHDVAAGTQGSELKRVAAQCDYLLIPILSSPIDVRSAVRFFMHLNRIDLLGNSDLQIGVVANRVKHNTRFNGMLRLFLQRSDLPLIATIRDTQLYVSAMSDGLSIFELPAYQVQSDLRSWRLMTDWLQ